MRIVDLDDVVQITPTVCKAAFESLGNIDSVFCDVEGVATVRSGQDSESQALDDFCMRF